MSETECYRCNEPLDIREGQWYSYRWNEEPSKELVETALEEREFRDWFQKNYVMCPECHDDIQAVIEE